MKKQYILPTVVELELKSSEVMLLGSNTNVEPGTHAPVRRIRSVRQIPTLELIP